MTVGLEEAAGDIAAATREQREKEDELDACARIHHSPSPPIYGMMTPTFRVVFRVSVHLA